MELFGGSARRSPGDFQAAFCAPYVVFPDTTLVAFATERPTSRDALLGISGVGQSKLERYGDLFLKVIRAHQG